MTRFSPSAFAAVLALSAAACRPDEVDRQAKVRIFSPEDPPKAVASASEKLNPQDVADNPRVARRILSMEADEVTQRLGPHAYSATVTSEWLGAKDKGSNKRDAKLQTRHLHAGQG